MGQVLSIYDWEDELESEEERESEDENNVYYQKYRCNSCNYQTHDDDPDCSICKKKGCMYAIALDEEEEEEEEEGSERIYQTIWDMIQASAQTATGTIEDLDHGQEDEYLQTLEGWGADQQALSTFQAMGFEEWKNVLMGKIRRGTTNRQIQFLRSLQTENLKRIKKLQKLKNRY